MTAELLATVPANWVHAYIGQIASGQSGFPCGIHNSIGSGVAHLRPMNIDIRGRLDLQDLRFVSPDANRLRLETGDVLFNNTNSPALVGKTAYFSRAGEYAFSNHMTRLRTTGEVDAKFLALQLHWLWMRGYFRERCTNHVNQASIATGSLLKSVGIKYPPLDEQRRIVEIIEEQFSHLDAADAATQRALMNLRRLSASAFDQAARAGQERGTIALGDVAEIVSGPAFKSKEFGSDNNGTRLLRGENIEPGSLRWNNTKTWPMRLMAGYEHLLVSSDDVILAMDRPVVSAGLKLACVKSTDLPALLVQRVARIRPRKDMDTAFIYLILSQPSFVRHVIAGQTGTQLPHITLAGIRSFPIPALSLKEQRSFVSKMISSISAIKITGRSLAIIRRRSDLLRHAILRNAFRGKLTSVSVA